MGVQGHISLGSSGVLGRKLGGEFEVEDSNWTDLMYREARLVGGGCGLDGVRDFLWSGVGHGLWLGRAFALGSLANLHGSR